MSLEIRAKRTHRSELRSDDAVEAEKVDDEKPAAAHGEPRVRPTRDVSASALERFNHENPGIRRARELQASWSADDIEGTDGDDHIRIRRSGDGAVLDVNGTTRALTEDELISVKIRAGAGNDVIEIEDGLTLQTEIDGGDGDDNIWVGATYRNVIRGGAGDDAIYGGEGGDELDGGDGNDWIEGAGGADGIYGGSGDDRIDGGAGDDQLDAGDGDDRIFGGDGAELIHAGAGDDEADGGDGRDTLYGLAGQDILRGGSGDDYLDGGQGADEVSGGAGDDGVFGGRGEDRLLGNDGDDVLAGGDGTDQLDAGEGADRVVVQLGDQWLGAEKIQIHNLDDTDAGSSIQIAGPDEFRAQVESDLDVMRSLPTGQRLLRAIDRTGKRVTIAPGHNTATPLGPGAYENPDGTPGSGSNVRVEYAARHTRLYGDDDEPSDLYPPSTLLFHELAHAHHMATGTAKHGTTRGTSNEELATVGLPYDHDGDPSTPMVRPSELSENGYRQEINQPFRRRYHNWDPPREAKKE